MTLSFARLKGNPILATVSSHVKNAVKPAIQTLETVHAMGRVANFMIVKVVTSSVCPTCNNLDPHGHYESSDFPLGFFEEEGEGVAQRQRKHDGRVWLLLKDISAEKLKRSVARGCVYCGLLNSVLKFDWPRWYENRVETETETFDAGIDLLLREGWPISMYAEKFADEYPNGGEFEIYKPSDPKLPGWSLIPHIGTAGQRYGDSRDEVVFDFILQCIATCNDEHPQCHLFKPAVKLPTRVLDLGPDDASIKIHESTEGEEGDYAALSHCWGGAHPLSTTTSTLAAHKTSLKWEDLPVMFQNAIEVLRRLNIKYLWIDSLCIIQDSRSDWDHESAKMADVYHNAYLTIAVGSSPNSNTPFLIERESLWTAQLLTFAESDGSHSYLQARRTVLSTTGVSSTAFESHFTRKSAYHGPLYSRAWAFQEQMLSRRAIHYTPGGVIWECATLRRSEDQIPPFASTLEPPGHDEQIWEKGNRQVDVQWRQCVMNYTKRALTFESDRFPALAGISTVFVKRKGKKGRYLAGLWESSFVTDLLWHGNPFMEGMVTEAFVAPSWSWASMLGMINYNTYDVREVWAELVEVECTLRGSNPYGEIKGGWLEMRGPVVPVWVTSGGSQVAEVCYAKNGKKSKKQFFFCDTRLVEDEGLLADGEKENTLRRVRSGEYSGWSGEGFKGQAWLLCVLRDRKGLRDVAGLVLGRSTEVLGSYERLGSVVKLPLGFYEQAVTTTVRIV